MKLIKKPFFLFSNFNKNFYFYTRKIINIMRNPSLLLLIVVFILAPFKLSAAADTVAVRETRIPVLIERQDNELFHLRIEAAQSQMLNEVKLDFGKDVNLNEIESVKLYYGGTESVERRGKTYFAPVDYISNNTPGKHWLPILLIPF